MNSLQGLLITTLALVSIGCNHTPPEPGTHRKAQEIRDAFELDFRRTYDPALGYPPKERLIEAYKQIEKMQKARPGGRSQGIDNAKFVERGPGNIGGRTRTILIDSRDPERNTIWAGSVAGGLWKTNDISSANPEWVAVNDYLANLAIGCMAQDPFNPEVFYVGTGEGFVNFDAVRGLGIFKSDDGGDSWHLLPSTDTDEFRFTRAIVIHPISGDVYAATRSDGVRRSTDGGQSWSKVLGVSLSASDDSMYDLQFSNGQLYASNSTNIYVSASGDRGQWTRITQSNSGFPSDLTRLEFSVCDKDPDVIYGVGTINGGASNIYRTGNGGATWNAVNQPTGGDFTNGQAWYDLEIAVDPFNCSHVVVGGVGSYRTLSDGLAWSRVDQEMHVDQHKTLFDPERQDVVYFGNDGGVWRSVNGSNVDPADRNRGYVTTQYYGGAIHPDTFSNYFLGGTQDNGSHRLNGNGVALADVVNGGDGFLCHIDQEDPNYQIVCSQFGNWVLSTNGGVNFSGGQSVNGGFLTPSDYDSKAKILYTQTNDNGVDFYRWHVVSNLIEPVDIEGVTITPDYIHVDPNVDNRVYFGDGGTVYRVDSAHTGSTVTRENILSIGGTISGIDVLRGNPLRMIVSKSNYGSDNIHVTSDGGENWTVVDGNLPDMPVRDVLFNPRDGNQAIIATEAGVWTTAMLDGSNTIWNPPAAERGSPIVRVDDLDIRYSDFVILAATHGRGLWTTSVFSDTRAKLLAPLVGYVMAPVEFKGEASLNADSYDWDFGDGTTSTEENPLKVFTEIGEYDVTLTINGSLSVSERIKILPEIALPYVKGRVYYGGDFDVHPDQYGVHTVSGSGWERGKSDVLGKRGARSGDNAFVIGINELTYKPNSESYLYLPAFDFSTESIYTFSFWATYFLHPGPDGFNVEYTINRGRTWQVLGSTSDKKWYNSLQLENSAFPDDVPYFTQEVGGYTNYQHDLSFLSGNADVAFRFVFRSESTGNHVGAAIDDVEILAFQGELKTNVQTFIGNFGNDKDIDLEWSTNPEYYCRKFEVERSINGIDFEKIDEVPAKSVLTAGTTNYTHTSSGGRDLYFYRLKVTSKNDETGYEYEFYTDIVTLRRNAAAPITVHNLYPNPFVDQVNITFDGVVNKNVVFEVFDPSGRLLQESSAFVNSPFYSLPLSRWSAGVYYLSIKIGEEDEKVYPILSSGL